MHDLHTILNWLTLHWPQIVALTGGGLSLSVVLEYVLSKLHIDSKKLAFTLLHLFSIAGALAAYIVDNKNVVASYGSLFVIASTVHRFLVSPVYANKIAPYLDFVAKEKASNAIVVPATPVQEPEQPVSTGSLLS